MLWGFWVIIFIRELVGGIDFIELNVFWMWLNMRIWILFVCRRLIVMLNVFVFKISCVCLRSDFFLRVFCISWIIICRLEFMVIWCYFVGYFNVVIKYCWFINNDVDVVCNWWWLNFVRVCCLLWIGILVLVRRSGNGRLIICLGIIFFVLLMRFW